jgi:predicted nucleic acid-binding protein
MDLVVDANIVIAALIKESVSYRLLFKDLFHLYTPEFIFTEIEKHKEELLNKTHRTTIEFYNVLDILRRRITFIPLEELTAYVEEAERITPDPDDMAYFATALKMRCAIWSNDKKLKEQDKIKVFSTHELMKL